MKSKNLLNINFNINKSNNDLDDKISISPINR